MLSSHPHPQETFAERLHRWRAGHHFTQAEAAEKLSIERSYFSQIERGRLPGNALRTRFLMMEKSSSLKPRDTHADGLRNLPVLSWVEAGKALDPEEIPRGNRADLVPSDVADERSFGIRLHGDAMEPKFSDGDIAIVLPATSATNGDPVVGNLKNQGMLCRIMQAQPDQNLIKLSSYNPAYPPIEYRRDDFHWIFPVATIIKQLRRS